MQRVRTTITLPEDLLQEVKIAAAKQKKPISKLLEEGIRIVINPRYTSEDDEERKKKAYSLFGKYSLGLTETYKRKDIYGEYLKKKVPR